MCACGLLFLIACDDSRPLPTSASPASATPTTTSAPFRVGCPLPCPLPGAHALSGVVRASGIPMAGARVGLVKIPEQIVPSGGPDELIASTATDAAGWYSFAKVENVSFSGALVAVSKPGYFTGNEVHPDV